ncbi:MAG TPA: non-homologous end-joining DNA ligase [Thermoanaerobaculia bacterium]
MAKSIRIDGRTIELSNTGKVLFPDAGLTKGDLVEYYRRVADTMLPHLRGRPVSMQRYPDGIDGKRFFQKDAPDYFPDWIRFEEVAKEGGTVRHVVCDDAATLVYLANQACITPHVWLSRAEHLERPDRMIFDLDPPEASEKGPGPARRAARTVRDRLRDLGFEPFLTTTGSRGFHVVVPLEPEAGFDEVRAFAQALARELAARQPDRLTVETRKDKRGGRVFLDYLRNGYAQTAVPPYAVRARPGAPVATPVSWEELSGLDPRRYTVKNLFKRLGQKEDPWAEIDRKRKPLGDARERLETEG